MNFKQLQEFKKKLETAEHDAFVKMEDDKDLNSIQVDLTYLEIQEIVSMLEEQIEFWEDDSK